MCSFKTFQSFVISHTSEPPKPPQKHSDLNFQWHSFSFLFYCVMPNGRAEFDFHAI